MSKWKEMTVGAKGLGSIGFGICFILVGTSSIILSLIIGPTRADDILSKLIG